MEYKFCPYCGAPFSETNRFCPNCGAKRESPPHHFSDPMTSKEIQEVLLVADHYAKKNQVEDELDCLKRAAPRASYDCNFLSVLGRAYRKNNQLASAVDCYMLAISLNPKFAISYLNLATVYTTKKEYAEAERNCKTAIRLMHEDRASYTTEDFAVAWANCAVAIGMQGRKDEARQLLKLAEEHGYANGAKVRSMAGL